MSIVSTLKFLTSHPLNRQRKVEALKRFVGWQIGSRLVSGPVAVPLVNDSRLLVSRGMTGATGNVYAGLHDFEDMAFLLHLLRPDDWFVDVGANIGSYTILASGAIGARSLSFEPLPVTYRHLVENIQLNDLRDLAQAHNLGVGKEEGVLHFTEALDTVNHVATESEIVAGNTQEVQVVTLDTVVADRRPLLMKIDVEGFEANVIAGAEQVLADPELDAVIMELNGSGDRYGFDEAAIHARMLEFGFNTFSYSPFDRRLLSLGGKNLQAGNTLYVKDLDRVTRRLAGAPRFRVLGQEI